MAHAQIQNFTAHLMEEACKFADFGLSSLLSDRSRKPSVVLDW